MPLVCSGEQLAAWFLACLAWLGGLVFARG